MPSPAFTALVGFERRLVVGVGGVATSNDPGVILTTYSLGSCVGVTVYDPVARAGGLLHAMLPDSGINPTKAAAQPAMFVNTGLPTLFRALTQLRAEKHRLQICLVGGAQILDQSGFFNIGSRNLFTLKSMLREYGLQPRAEEVGGLVNRTVYLRLDTGEVRLKTSGQPGETVLFKG